MQFLVELPVLYSFLQGISVPILSNLHIAHLQLSQISKSKNSQTQLDALLNDFLLLPDVSDVSEFSNSSCKLFMIKNKEKNSNVFKKKQRFSSLFFDNAISLLIQPIEFDYHHVI